MLAVIMNDKPFFLIQQNPRLSIRESEIIVDEILNRLQLKLPSKSKQREFIIKNQGKEKEEKKQYFELVRQVREHGVCYFLQHDLDEGDNIFGGQYVMTTPNWQIKINTEWAGYSKEFQGPFRNNPSEIDLSGDIEFYKDETCIESNDQDFNMCSRNYRGYLFSSIALVDAYINKHILIHSYHGLASEEFMKLKDLRNIEEKIELFVEIFCCFPFSELKKSIFWDHFKRLKNLRNEVVHSVHPFLGIEIKEMAFNLNLSINGIGGLLRKLQEGQKRFSLAFIEQIRTSPAIHYNQITLKGDGQKHEEKKIFSKIYR